MINKENVSKAYNTFIYAIDDILGYYNYENRKKLSFDTLDFDEKEEIVGHYLKYQQENGNSFEIDFFFNDEATMVNDLVKSLVSYKNDDKMKFFNTFIEQLISSHSNILSPIFEERLQQYEIDKFKESGRTSYINQQTGETIWI